MEDVSYEKFIKFLRILRGFDEILGIWNARIQCVPLLEQYFEKFYYKICIGAMANSGKSDSVF